MSFMSAQRPQRSQVQRLSVYVDGRPLISNMYPFDIFTTHTISFTTNSFGYADVLFENTSPAGDASVYIDNIQMCSSPLCPTVLNGGFEADGHGESHVMVTAITGWTSSSSVGINPIVAANGT